MFCKHLNGESLLKKNNRLKSCTAMLLLMVCIVMAAPQELNKNKLTQPEKTIEPFQRGEPFVKVIVNLNHPRDILAKTNWRSQKSLSVLREEIRQRQQQVLTTLTQRESIPRHQFENLVSFSAEVSFAGLKKLSNNPMVESIEPVFLLEPHLQQGISLMNAAVTRTTYNGQGIAIAICDTGVDYTHSALGGGGFPNDKVIGGYDTGGNDSDPIPEGEAHGTACAGIAAGDLASVSDYIGGVAYGAKLYALKITSGSSGSAYNDDIAAAWDWCVTHQNDDPANPIMVISTSFGGGRFYSSCDSDSSLLTNAANNAVSAGITVLVSSGNDGYCDSISSPACISSIISVGAVYDASLGTYGFCLDDGSCATEDSTTFSCDPGQFPIWQTTGADIVTEYSNTASFLDILAPSHDAYTTDIVGSDGYSSGDYDDSFGGTSAACPYAAGAVAILQSAAKAITGDYLPPAEIRDLLTFTGDDVTDGKVAITKPRINVGTAMGTFNESPPVASDINKTVYVDTPTPITLNATDEGLPNPPGALNYIITTLPNYGVLNDPVGGSIGTVPYILLNYGNQVIYTPDTAYLGADSFQFKANDGGTGPDGGDSNTATTSINVQMLPQVIYSATMDTDPNWTYQSDWEWGAPQGSGGQYGEPDPTSGYTGGNVVGYNLSGDYADNIGSTLWTTTPAINCNDTTNIILRFYRWLNVERSIYDHAYIAVSSNGTNWTMVWENPDSHIQDSAWSLQEIDISTIADNQATVYVRWGIGPTDSSWRYSGWNIDDVEIIGDLTVIPQRTLTLSSTSGGSVNIPGEGPFQYSQTAVVDVNAIADLCYHFVGWTGSGVDAGKVADPNLAGTTVTMDGDYTLQANFAIDTFTLDYAAGSGGSLTGDTSQVVDCNSNGTAVTAVQDTGYHFVDWSDTSTDNPRTDLNVTENINVIANFSVDTFTLDYAAGAGGSITGNTSQVVGYGGDGTEATAVPDTGYRFVNWSDASTENPRTDTNVTSNINVTANFAVEQITISGLVTEPDPNSPVADVFIATEGDPNAFSDPNGIYQLTVDYGWSGTLTPSKAGYTFEPNSITYNNVTSDPNDNFIATLNTFIISGYAVNAETFSPLTDVLVTPDDDGGPFTSKYYSGSDVTDANGFYEVLVDYNFSGDVVPSKYAYAFEPNSITYSDIIQDTVADQNYVGTLLTYTITGYVTNPCELPIEDVFISTSPGGDSDITDPNGFYEVWVDYNWSGTITSAKNHYTFDPNSITYTEVLSILGNQNYVATNIYDLNCNDAIELGDLAILCNNWLTVGPAVPGDFYKDEDNIVNLLDFADFAGVWRE